MSIHVQGSAEWLDFRRDKIGASEIGVVMGLSPFKTPLQLYRQKKRLIPDDAENLAMYMGKSFEPEALSIYCRIKGEEFFPQVIVHPEYDWMIASFDGLNLSGTKGVEIKCGEKAHRLAKEGVIPDYYMAQLQQQMFCRGLDRIDYFTFYGNDHTCRTIYRDDEFIEKMVAAGLAFMKCLRGNVEPEASDRDYDDKEDCAMWRELCERLRAVDRQLSDLQSVRDTIKQELISIAKERSCRGHGVVLRRSLRKGSIDYKSIPELSNVDLESHRGPPSLTWILRASSA